MFLKLVLCVILVAHAHGQGETENRLVNSPQGPVRGYKENDIFVFHDIPYARAPTGVDKFKGPLDADTWTEPFEALDRGIICPQVGLSPDLLQFKNEQEDCLVATVYAPDTEESNLPVVIYVHGGSYQQGWGDMMQPRSLTSTGKIIGVTFNYRLAVHGFLCLGTSGAPGNAGMKDIVALLRWVNTNIASFGGNPNDVTIAGFSAGASAVDLVMLSKSANGLYHRVVPDSGANVAVWSVQIDPIENAKHFARQQGFTDVDDIEALEQFYTTASMETLTRPEPPAHIVALAFTPCIERDIGEERFLDDAPVNILKEGGYNKVPMLYGITQEEGLLYVSAFEEYSARMNEKFSDFLPVDLQFESDEIKELVAQRVKEFYFRNQPVTEANIHNYIDFFTDVVFAYPTLRAIQLHVEAGHNEIYLYEYSFVAEEFPSAMENVDVRGSDHVAQTTIVLDFFVPFYIPLFHTSRSLEFQVTMRELWLNFMTTGTPVPEGSSLPAWPPVGFNGSPHMNLDEVSQLRSPLLPSRAQFWDDIYDQYYRMPVAPPAPPETPTPPPAPNSRYVETPQGPVVGYKEDDLFVFHSIPYAVTPIGVDKFKAPLPAPTWTEPFEALDRGIICPQVGLSPDLLQFKNEQEDCLVATVYAPDTEESNLPVVIYVHGGSYQQGWGDMMQPRSLTSTGKIIGVTFNYRLAVHGFLCLGTSGAPGNAGMKDIVALLRWVNTNIASFGGNPNDVTIAGFSAGASAVDLVMLSKSANGLYNRVVPDSGANVAVWSVQIDPIENAKHFARQQGFADVDDIEALEQFYTTASMETLTRPEPPAHIVALAFTPCIERDIGEERFLEDAPVNILKEGGYNKVPMLYGITREEGLLYVIAFEEYSARMNEKFSDFLPVDLQFESDEIKELVAQRVKEFYFGNQPVSEANIHNYIDFFTDVAFAYPTLRAIQLHVEAGHNEIYLYEYSFVAEEFPSAMENVDVRGADHVAQTTIVLDFFVPFYIPLFHTSRSLEFQVTMRELWLNFMTTGTPVPEGSSLPAWPPVGFNGSPHMNLDEISQLGGPLLASRAQFWDDIYDQYYRMPVAPPAPPETPTPPPAPDSLYVETPQGPVIGYKEDDLFVFHSIPYAVTPIGVDKFKAPLPAPTWTEPFEALDRGIICPQVGLSPDLLQFKNEQEDCLVATVYAPNTEESNLPVVIYVHGGSYQLGWGDMMQPRSLTRTGKIIGVTFNYRLAVHGFLCLGTSGAPGNAGMKDIVALLRWVNTNIASFGGNPNDVTIAGFSAGASAVDLVMLSKTANGLYHRVVPDSGANVAVWSVQIDPIENAKHFARQQGFADVDDIEALEQFYTTASMETLTRPEPPAHIVSLAFTPCIERDIGEERFLEDAPVNILKEGGYNKVPMLYGITREEGLLYVSAFEEYSARMNEKFSDFLPVDLQFESNEIKELVAQSVKEFYFGNQPVSEANVHNYIDFFTDVVFAYPTLRAIQLHVEAGHNEIYLYEYSFVAEEFPSAMENVDVRGADHTAQTTIVLDFFVPFYIQLFHTSRSLEFQITMRELWLNFMTTGTPVPEGSSLPPWEPVGENGNPHMNLDETSQMGGSLLSDRAQFWDDIYERHYRAPVAPSSATIAFISPVLALLLFILNLRLL